MLILSVCFTLYDVLNRAQCIAALFNQPNYVVERFSTKSFFSTNFISFEWSVCGKNFVHVSFSSVRNSIYLGNSITNMTAIILCSFVQFIFIYVLYFSFLSFFLSIYLSFLFLAQIPILLFCYFSPLLESHRTR